MSTLGSAQGRKALLDALVQEAIRREHLEIPQWRFDGEEVKTAEEAAALLRIPVSEARARLEQKDIYTSLGAHASVRGVGTVVQGLSVQERAGAIAYRRRKKKKRRKRETS